MNARLITLTVLAALVLATFATVSSIPVHHDIGWPLHVAERMLGGAELYVDVIEVHPPLIVGVGMVAVLLGKLPLLTPIVAYHLLALLAVLISLALCWRALVILLADYRVEIRQHALLAIAFVLLPLVGYSFGLEEHLMLSLVLPYLFAVAAAVSGHELGPRTRLIAGVMAGLGFSMKPFYGPLWLLLAAYVVWQRGRPALRRAEIVAPAAVIVGYIIFTLLFARGYFTVAGWAADVYFDYFPTTLHTILFSLGTAAVSLALLIHVFIGARGALDAMRRVLVLTLLGCFVVVLLQRKGWSYHWYPAYAIAILLIDFSVLEWLRARGASFGRALQPRIAVMAGAILILAFAGWRLAWSRSYWRELAGSPYHLPQLQNVVQRFGDGGPIVALSTAMPVAFPLVNVTGVGWTSRFSCLWVLPGLYADTQGDSDAFPYHDLANMTELERYLIDALAADLSAGNPTLIIVDRAAPTARMRGFNYIEYFARDPRLRQIFSRYGLIGEVGQYQIFKRISPAV